METIEQEVVVRPDMHTYYRSYRVDKNDTGIKMIPANDFSLVGARLTDRHNVIYTLQPDYEQYYQTTSLVKAMEKAKEGALTSINELIKRGDDGVAALLQYRIDHYEDLHVNLVDANIQLVEQQIVEDRYFKWTPYRIKS
ncbi:hypothetical protein PQ469_06190 [Mucilaginibacter sp. KACC 22773]|jgi:hypothetical protein|uniref:hypothetical protein n=1 Tax=Mucilaginibacter sp. KACC 22773 TaxID=3025671 RepID=UPI0023658A54|nr:hypothetical protein [Mucilaginibacter sp. KACC 22773]WDF79593.1 hypothetical protein PQ469_06190 [Mucilaginibacter sp. KACC 22773]